jgi:hypothetical protein
MQIFRDVVLGVSLISTGALAETVGPDTSYYCHTGVKAPSGSDNDATFFKQVRASCRPGDTIVISNNDTYRAARICDFSRSIATAGGQIICIIAGPERPYSIRRPQGEPIAPATLPACDVLVSAVSSRPAYGRPTPFARSAEIRHVFPSPLW